MWFMILFILLVLTICWRVFKQYKYWEEKGAAYVKPWPLLGNMGSFFFRKCAMADMMVDMYNVFPDQRYTGLYMMMEPMLLIRDPELIKQITVKEAETFPEHKQLADIDTDPLWGKNLFAMKGEKWQQMRSTLSPAFTSSKMKMMFGLMKESANQFTDYFKNQSEVNTVDMKEVFTRFTNDVIGNTAFGVKCDSLKDRENEFYLMGKDATDFSGIRGLVFFLYSISPWLMKTLKIRIFGEKVSSFFRGLIKETIRIREEKGIVRPDMIHLLMQARKGILKDDDQNKSVDSGFAVAQDTEINKFQNRKKSEITDDDIAAQALIFFFAGFDTSSTLMCYICYELAVNVDIQDKLVAEIQKALEECNGDITYETLLGMKYLDMIISETLRKWPPTEATDRQCVKNFIIEPVRPGEKALHLDADTNCLIPIYPIHRDPKFYPNPDKFDPERFSDENKSSIQPFTFIPFGTGPRSCIGSRFALLESKLIIFEILSKFELVVVEKTQIPLVLRKGDFNLLTETGIWLGLKAR